MKDLHIGNDAAVVRRIGRLLRVAAGSANVVAFLLLLALPAKAVEIVYMAPDGLDANPGLTPATAIYSLCRAQEVLRSGSPDQDAEVRIKQGVYYEPGAYWNYYRPGRSISFVPIDWDPGDGIRDIAGRPIFRSSPTNDQSPACQTKSQGYWFRAKPMLPNDSEGNKKLVFRYLQVERYTPGGIEFDGGTKLTQDGITVPASAGINGNTVLGMMFYRLGSKLNSPGNGRGAIIATNSSDNDIRYNHFVQIENRTDEVSLIHGVYLAHHSSNNIVDSNRFDRVTGDPIRTRNDSNGNVFINNEFVRSGYSAYYSEWFCDGDCPVKHGIGRECASHNNEFKYNYLESGYNGNAQGLWLLTPAGLNYAGGSGCDNEGQVRLDTQGNTRP